LNESNNIFDVAKSETIVYFKNITAATWSINKIIPVYIALAEGAAKEGEKTEPKVVGQYSNEIGMFLNSEIKSLLGRNDELKAEVLNKNSEITTLKEKNNY
jgi:hypothetical protein